MKSRFDHTGLLQPSLPGFDSLAALTDDQREGAEGERGAVFTRREVVDFILDLAGYTVDQPLHRLRFLEPSFGNGDFLLPAIDRLLQAWRHATAPAGLRGGIRGVEIHAETFDATRAEVLDRLQHAGISRAAATDLADHWLVRGDFLLLPLPDGFDVVAGNPPYVRQELIPDRLLAEYRARYSTVYDRADLYVPFIERSLRLLAANGHLAFICADRWMKNRYGGPLRGLVAEGYDLRFVIDMVDTRAFHSEVAAYPAITVISRRPAGATRVAHRPSTDAEALKDLARALLSPEAPGLDGDVREVPGVVEGAEPWIFGVPDQLRLVRRLEQAYPCLEEAGCRVGIGVATGADRAFIGPMEELDVEADRKLPLVMTRDLVDGSVEWRGLGVINPFAADGSLVDLAGFPRLRAYLEARREQIAGRHVARRIPANWYRTIDRIDPGLAQTPKLLIPDIKGEAHIVYEGGRLYPHHNLYYITSSVWDLEALQAILLSGIARLFVGAYSTRMRGGYLRFQAQYLRRIRIPHWKQVSSACRRELIAAARRRDAGACDEAVAALYGLTPEEQSVLRNPVS